MVDAKHMLRIDSKLCGLVSALRYSDGANETIEVERMAQRECAWMSASMFVSIMSQR